MLAGHRDREDDNPLAADGMAKSPAWPASEASAGAPPPRETLKPEKEEPETEDSEEPEEGKKKEKTRSYSKSHSASRFDILQNLGKRPGHDRSVYKTCPNNQYKERRCVIESWQWVAIPTIPQTKVPCTLGEGHGDEGGARASGQCERCE
jgi:hypothetical protein